MDVNIYIREMDTAKLVKTIVVHDVTERKLERVEMGLMYKIDLDKFYVDTDDADAALEGE